MLDPNAISLNRDIALLAPFVKDKILEGVALCEKSGFCIGVFEGYRSPERQTELYRRGREIPGSIITRAQSWQSFHQYGLAADMVFRKEGRWTWEGPWDEMRNIFEGIGFETLNFERDHIQLCGSLSWQKAKELFDSGGFPAVWAAI